MQVITPSLCAVTLLVAVEAQSTASWTSFADRAGHAVAHDPSGRVTLFGGEVPVSGQILGDTYELGVAGWQARLPGTVPLPRFGHAMAGGVDANDAPVTFMFGGLLRASPPVRTAETWVYSGDSWTLLQPFGTPSVRNGHAMAHAGVLGNRSNVIVMFGGTDGTYLNDTWEFDPQTATWGRISTPQTPSARFGHSMAYDGSGRVILFGGSGTAGFPSPSDTWTYDGTTWTQVGGVVGVPYGRRFAAMALGDRGKIVMFGGESSAGGVGDDTWLCVAEEDGAPLGDAAVTLHGGTRGAKPSQTWSTVTRADGRFALTIPPRAGDEVVLDLRGEGRVPRAASWSEPGAGTRIDLGDVRLARGHRVGGVVVDAAG